MGDIDIHWTFPPEDFLKVNVHGLFSEQPFMNGNVSGIGVVIRDHWGEILCMAAGSLGRQEARENELYALMFGLKMAYKLKKYKIFLEIDTPGAYHEWRNSTLGGEVDPNHAYVLQQLNQRREDPNLALEVIDVEPERNRLAMYLAQYGVEKWTRMVVIRELFGRVKELWSEDMGL